MSLQLKPPSAHTTTLFRCRDQSMVNNYYSIATDWYEFGWGGSFHFAHTFHNETFDEVRAQIG